MAMNGNEYFRTYVEPELKECDTAQQMLDVLQAHYNLDAPLGTITHLAFAQGLRKAVQMINPQIKE